MFQVLLLRTYHLLWEDHAVWERDTGKMTLFQREVEEHTTQVWRIFCGEVARINLEFLGIFQMLWNMQVLSLEEGREIGYVLREPSLGEEDKMFTGEVLLLKRSSCSVGNFAAKLLSVIFKPEELINHNCTGTRGKGQPNAAKIDTIKKYVL